MHFPLLLMGMIPFKKNWEEYMFDSAFQSCTLNYDTYTLTQHKSVNRPFNYIIAAELATDPILIMICVS